jgi:predicted ATPase
LLVTPKTIQFNSQSDCEIDILNFTRLIAACHQHTHRRIDSCRVCLDRLVQVVALYQGEFLAGFNIQGEENLPFEEWLRIQREKFQIQAIELLNHLISWHERRNEYQQRIPYLQQQLRLEPWRESSHRYLMQTMALSGQTDAALAHYQTIRRILRNEFNTEPDSETQKLYAQLREGTPLLHSATQLTNLPVYLTPFIGREEILAQLDTLLGNPAYRLITISGLGGVGKTRIAVEAAYNQMGVFAHGVCFVSLLAVTSAVYLIPVLVQALGIPSSEHENPKTQLYNYLQERELLLVLDSFEQLLNNTNDTLSPAVDVLLKLLQHAPGLTILVTSRERLNIQAEIVFRLEGLPVPNLESYRLDNVIERYHQNPALQLFIERAGRVSPGFMLTENNLHDVITICRVVEGLPLGIKLAAAWAGQLSCAAIAQAIQTNLNLLTTRLGDIPERHRSIRTAFEYSWKLLNPEEQQLLAKCAVFRNSFTFEAAIAILSKPAQPAIGHEILLSQIESLVTKSLLRWSIEEERYELHELVHQFVVEKLNKLSDTYTDTGEDLLHQTYKCHTTFYLGFVAQHTLSMQGPAPQIAIQKIRRELGNIYAAWQWAIAHSYTNVLEYSLDGVLLFCEISELLAEAAELFNESAAHI